MPGGTRRNDAIPVVLFGLGAIGREVARAVLEEPGLQLAGAVDSSPDLAGRPLGQVLRRPAAAGIRIVPDLAGVRAARRPRVVIHATGSHLRDVAAQVEAAAAAGYAVVSSCEELTWPWARHPKTASRLEQRARAAGVAVLGTGVNPGFVMDLLPVVLSGITRQIRHVHVVRVVDASTRRLPLQRKIGAGLTPSRFRAAARAGRLGHVGLPESAHMIAHALGWSCSRLTNRVEPVLARRAVRGPVPVAAGQVTGIDQRVVVLSGGREVIRLELTMALGAGPPHDHVALQGTPPLSLRLEGGAPGDAATVAALVRGAFSVASAPPGLWTPITIPFAARRRGDSGRGPR